MSWVQLFITCDALQAEQMGDQLLLLGAQAVSFQDAADRPIYEPKPGTSPTLWPTTVITGLFTADHAFAPILVYFEQQAALGHIKNLHTETLADQDWVRLNLKNFQPILIGKRLCICPSWLTPPDPNRINVILDPGLAFGTGTHPTTLLCLEALEREPTQPAMVIDYGCGSGILGIAALKLGAQKVIAVDHDTQALTATTMNAANNAITTQLETYLPDQLDFNPQADLIMANILAQPLIDLAPHFLTLLAPRGKILLSGVLEEQIAMVLAIYKPWFELDYQVKDGWGCIVGTKI